MNRLGWHDAGQVIYGWLMQLARPLDPAINDTICGELEAVEACFAAELISDLPCVNHLVDHIEQYRGKMLRPRLVLVSAMACTGTHAEPGVTEAHRLLATVVEMVHMATLVHDDILDSADVRRHGSTVNHLEGNETAVMLGDYLISHAYHLCSSLDALSELPISQAVADTTNTVCEGELLQLANRRNWALDEATYFEIIRRKTASLCGQCCRLSALLGGATDATAEDLFTYGEHVGIAFQIVDDLLDLVGAEATVGKTLGRDLDKGKLTLPLIHYLGQASEAQKQRLQQRLGVGPSGDGDSGGGPGPISELINESGSVAYAQATAERLIERAKSALAAFEDGAAKGTLLNMADAVLTRQF